jgi:hypothetical protein
MWNSYKMWERQKQIKIWLRMKVIGDRCLLRPPRSLHFSRPTSTYWPPRLKYKSTSLLKSIAIYSFQAHKLKSFLFLRLIRLPFCFLIYFHSEVCWNILTVHYFLYFYFSLEVDYEQEWWMCTSHVRFPVQLRRQAAVARSVYVACGLQATDLFCLFVFQCILTKFFY